MKNKFQDIRFLLVAVALAVGFIPMAIFLAYQETLMSLGDGVFLLLGVLMLIFPAVSISIACVVAQRIDPELKTELEAEKVQNKPENREARKRIAVLSILCLIFLVMACVAIGFEWDNCAQIFVLIFALFAGMLFDAMRVKDNRESNEDKDKEGEK